MYAKPMKFKQNTTPKRVGGRQPTDREKEKYYYSYYGKAFLDLKNVEALGIQTDLANSIDYKFQVPSDTIPDTNIPVPTEEWVAPNGKNWNMVKVISELEDANDGRMFTRADARVILKRSGITIAKVGQVETSTDINQDVSDQDQELYYKKKLETSILDTELLKAIGKEELRKSLPSVLYRSMKTDIDEELKLPKVRKEWVYPHRNGWNMFHMLNDFMESNPGKVIGREEARDSLKKNRVTIDSAREGKQPSIPKLSASTMLDDMKNSKDVANAFVSIWHGNEKDLIEYLGIGNALKVLEKMRNGEVVVNRSIPREDIPKEYIGKSDAHTLMNILKQDKSLYTHITEK